MSNNTKIEWTDATWNPQHGCTVVSAGCANCYAIKEAYIHGHNHGAAGKRFQGLVVKQGNGVTGWTGAINFHEDRLLDPLSWRKPKRVFVNSMSDTFHADVPDEWLDRMFAVMALCPHITFQVLTKRPERMAAYLSDPDTPGRIANAKFEVVKVWPVEPRNKRSRDLFKRSFKPANNHDPHWPLSNVWCGTSVEDQKTADDRIPHLLRASAAVRFLSCEPLLGKLDLSAYIGVYTCFNCGYRGNDIDGSDGDDEPLWCPSCETREGEGFGFAVNDPYVRSKIHWLIVGGESGPKARPMHPDWATSLRNQCAVTDADVAFFFKQCGEYSPLAPTKPNGAYDLSSAISMANDGTVYRPEDLAYPDGTRYGEAVRAGHDKAHLTALYRVGKKGAGRILDDRTWDEFPATQEAKGNR